MLHRVSIFSYLENRESKVPQGLYGVKSVKYISTIEKNLKII